MTDAFRGRASSTPVPRPSVPQASCNLASADSLPFFTQGIVESTPNASYSGSGLAMQLTVPDGSDGARAYGVRAVLTTTLGGRRLFGVHRSQQPPRCLALFCRLQRQLRKE